MTHKMLAEEAQTIICKQGLKLSCNLYILYIFSYINRYKTSTDLHYLLVVSLDEFFEV